MMHSRTLEDAKALFAKLDMEYPPVAVRFSFARPENLPRTDEMMSLCQFVKKAQVENRGFYTTKEDDDCFGRMMLGMIDKPPFAASGQAGVDFGVFATHAPNARLYTQVPTLPKGSVNYVSFVPLGQCDFEPDLLICVADTTQAAIIMRATSYYSGDVWESKATPVMSCAWMYSYPYTSGKVNTIISGMGHGMTRRKIYPAGMQIISIPYSKIGETVRALGEMRWDPIAFSGEEADKAELARRMDGWKKMQEQEALSSDDDGGLMPTHSE